MTTFKRGCVILIIMWTSACGGENTTTTSPSTSTLASASSTTPGGPVLTTLHARSARAIHAEDAAIITFHVQDPSGLRIAGALLEATSTDVGPWKGLTDGAGNFTANLFAGRYILEVSAAGFEKRTLPANLAATGTINIGLERAGTTRPGQLLLMGRVTDGTSGGPLPNITLTLSGTASAITTTGGNGNYQFDNLAAGSYTLLASPVGYVPNPQPITLTAATTVLDLVLQRGSGPTGPTGSSINIQGTPCTEVASCTYIASASGGQPPYTYDWTFSGNGTSVTYSGRPAQFQPALGCGFVSPTGTIMTISVTITSSAGSPLPPKPVMTTLVKSAKSGCA